MSARVTVAAPRIAPGDSIDMSWSDLNYAHKDDWVALCARGAKTDTLATRKTGGTKKGAVRLAVSKSMAPGEYEVRLYSSGGWTLAGSAPVAIVAAGKATLP